MSQSPVRLEPWLAAMVALLAIAAAPRVSSPGEIREVSERVFQRPEFRAESPASPPWLARLLRDFFAWLGGLYENAPGLFWVLLMVCLGALGVLVTFMVLHIRSIFAIEKGWSDRRTASDERLRLSEGHWKDSNREAIAGNYTEAIRHLFLSLVYRFDERGRVSFQRAYTNREYLDLFVDRLPVREALGVIVDMLDEYWYGQRPCSQEQYENCLAIYNRLAT